MTNGKAQDSPDTAARDAESRDPESRDTETRDAQARDAQARDPESRDPEARDARSRDADSPDTLPDAAPPRDGDRRVINLTPTGPNGVAEPLPPTPPTFYEQIGGERTFRELVAHFYRGVAEDPVLRPLYPEDDLGPAEERLRMFLEQYWGGPRTYSERRGHPRLRMRHIPFAIGPAERDAWLARMSEAIDAVGITGEARQTLWRYLTMAAGTLVNRPTSGNSD